LVGGGEGWMAIGYSLRRREARYGVSKSVFKLLKRGLHSAQWAMHTA